MICYDPCVTYQCTNLTPMTPSSGEVTSADIVAAERWLFFNIVVKSQTWENTYVSSKYLLYVADTYSTIDEQHLAQLTTVPRSSSNLSWPPPRRINELFIPMIYWQLMSETYSKTPHSVGELHLAINVYFNLTGWLVRRIWDDSKKLEKVERN